MSQQNNNIENISKLQKIAMVTGIPYDDALTLSYKYPFAVFFSDGNPIISNSDDPTPPSIIKQGIRFTRFIDVNPDQKEMQINDHTIILTFEYDSGLLSIGDKYKLDNFELLSLSYKSIKNGEQIELSDNLNVDAQDNKFELTFKFNSEDDVSKISKLLSFSYNNYVQYTNYKVDIYDKSKATYYFDVIRTCENPLDIVVTSVYANNITNQIQFINVNEINNKSIVLNPTDFNVYTISQYGLYIIDSTQYISLDHNESCKIKVNLFCDIYNASFQDLKIIVKPYDNNINITDTNGNSNIQTIGNNITKDFYFNIIAGEGNPNVETPTKFNIEIYRTDLENDLLILSKKINVKIKGKSIDTYWYLGLEYPNETNIQEFNKPVGQLQWGDEDDERERSIECGYFAIAENYKDMVYPRNNFYDAYINEYCDARNWFDYDNPIIEVIHGINMYIYAYNVNELGNIFYGKIQ